MPPIGAARAGIYGGVDAIPDSEVYLQDDWGDNKLTNRNDSGTTTYNGVEGVYRPEWTTRSGGPTAANQMLELPDAGNLTADINLDLSSQITWDFTGVDVSESSDGNNIFGVGLWGGATTVDAGRPGDSIYLEIRPENKVSISDANFDAVVVESSPPTGSPMDITVTRSSDGTFELIINNSSIGTGAASATPSSITYMNIARRTDSSASYYLDEVKVY